jgi:Zinc carboxypeptidase
MHARAAVLALVAALLVAAPAAGSPVATSDQQYTTLGRVFPDPLAGCKAIGSPICSPGAQGTIPASSFIGVDELVDALKYMNPRWSRYMEVLVLDGKVGDGSQTKDQVQADPAKMFPGDNLASLEFTPKPQYVSAGLPTTTLERKKSDLIVVRVTDETVPDAGKKRYALSLSIHGIERAGAEGGTRAMEDLVTAYDTGLAGKAVVPAAVQAGAPTFADVLKKAIVYFTYPNPDGWRRGSVQSGGVFFQRYNGNGVDPNRDWPDIGYSFRPYSGVSEPETNAFIGFYDGVRQAGPFTAGDDLHGQPEADALSYTLLPHGRHSLGKDARIRETAKAINRSTYDAVKWSPIVKPNDEVADPESNPDPCVPGELGDVCTKIYGQTWGSVYDTINYTTTGALGDWFDSKLGLQADGIDNEMAFSHLDKNIVFDPHTEQMHVDGNKALIYAHLVSMLAPVSARMDAPGAQGYVPNAREQRAEQVVQGDAPANTGPQDDVDGATATPSADGSVYEFRVQRRAATRDVPGIYDGGMRVEATLPNVQGIATGSGTLAVQCQHCDEHPGTDPASEGEWTTVAEDFNQSPLYLQAGLTATVNRPQANYRDEQGRAHQVPWRVVVALPAGVTAGPARIDVHFSSAPASIDGDTNGDSPSVLKGYDVANTDFFADLNDFIADPADRFKAVDPRAVIAGDQSLDGLRNLVLADDPLPGYTGGYGGQAGPSGPPTGDVTFSDTKPTTPSQGTDSCVRSDASTDSHDFTIGPDDGNASLAVRITWPDPVGDFDLYLQRKSGDAFVDVRSATTSDPGAEELSLDAPPAGDYRVQVVNCTAVADTSYSGTVSFTALPASDGTGAYTTAEKDAWMARLADWVRAGGNLVLTDGALRALPELVDIPRSQIGQTTVYTGQVTFRRCTDYAADDTCTSDVRTLDDPLARGVNQPGSRFNTGMRRQVFEPTPLGFAIQDGSGADASSARQWDVDALTFQDAGGRVAATSVNSGTRDAGPVLERATLGEIALGAGTVRIAGALLPQPSEQHDHPLGLEPYALTYTGYILACNLLDATCPGVSAEAAGSGSPAAATPAPLGARSPATASIRAAVASSGATGRAQRVFLVRALRAGRSFGARGLTVRFALTRAAAVRVELVRGGRMVRRVSAGRLGAGSHAVRVAGRGLRRGAYRLRVVAVSGGRREVTALAVRRA